MRNTTVLKALRPLFVALLLATLGVTASAADTADVSVGDNFFSPQKIRIRPGDEVVWKGVGIRRHNVTSDTGLFESEDLFAGDEFSFTFAKKGTYVYHCTIHGKKGRVGMFGVIVVGDPQKDPRDKLIVPDDYRRIQAAVDAARSGTTIVVRPGRYREQVLVETPNLVIRGVDRFRSVLDGRDALQTGITVTADRVSIRNLTIRNYSVNGILLEEVDNYTVERVDSIKNRAFGIHATGSHDGVIRDSFVWGSGDAAVHVSSCFACGALVDNVRAQMSYMGYWGEGTTGVIIRDSIFRRNGVGIVSASAATPIPSGGTFIYANKVASNNITTVPPAGFSNEFGVPFGTGVWLAGARNDTVQSNVIESHDRYGILVSSGFDAAVDPVNNRVTTNTLTSTGIDLAYDGTGVGNCWSGNAFATSGPSDIESIYPCDGTFRSGVPYAPVETDVRTAISTVERGTEEPPEPQRPPCQSGRPGCRR
jgi:plastocyanin